MYSVVLMMAMTTGGEAADFGGRGCRGCCGGCYGGCYGGGWGCHGCRGRRGCHGCYGGGCYGGGCYGGGCYGGGCYGGGCYGGGGCCGGYIVPSGVQQQQDGKKKGKQQQQDEGQVQTGPAPAYVVVQVPADARVTVDGAATTSTSAVRTFQTPALARDKVYGYEMTAEFQQDGKTVKITKHVQVQAGRTANVDLRQPAATVASR
jgi:uncharacterized protein (TIGR03000 family)